MSDPTDYTSYTPLFAQTLNSLAKGIADDVADKGFITSWDNVPEKLCLIHSEISEALEAFRKPDKKDEHLPQFPAITLELADAMIRIFDLAGALRLDLGHVLMAKVAYNRQRPHKHGKEF